jgi:hypothetical protein
MLELASILDQHRGGWNLAESPAPKQICVARIWKMPTLPE